MLDIFVGFFSNIFNIIMLLIFLLVGVIIGIVVRPRWGNMVMKLLPRDHRFLDFDIDEETAVTIECKEKKGFPPHRFIKLRPGFVGKSGRFIKRSVTRYLGKEGTAYTWQTEQNKFTEIPGGLPTALKGLWGKEFYEEMPPEQKQQLEENKLLVTVDLDDGLTPEGYASVAEEDIKREEDRKAAETLWEGKKKQEKGLLVNQILAGIAGFGVACALMLIGILG